MSGIPMVIDDYGPDWVPRDPERSQFHLWEFADGEGGVYRNVLLWVGGYRAWHVPGMGGSMNSREVAALAGARHIREISTVDQETQDNT